MTLIEFVNAHTDRGECRCGKCFDRGMQPDPTGHVADMVFFPVAAVDSPDRAEFERLIRETPGEFCKCNPLDGQEHGYIELGGWLGDQGLALKFMGLGSLLGVFMLLTPKMMGVSEDLAMQMAGMGLVTVQAKTEA